MLILVQYHRLSSLCGMHTFKCFTRQTSKLWVEISRKQYAEIYFYLKSFLVLSCAQNTHVSMGSAVINGLAELSCTVISVSKKSSLLFAVNMEIYGNWQTLLPRATCIYLIYKAEQFRTKDLAQVSSKGIAGICTHVLPSSKPISWPLSYHCHTVDVLWKIILDFWWTNLQTHHQGFVIKIHVVEWWK